MTLTNGDEEDETPSIGGDIYRPYKFVQNYWVEDLLLEYRRVKDLNIGPVTEIRQVHPGYHYFHLLDPDNNVIEVTGGYAPEKSGRRDCPRS